MNQSVININETTNHFYGLTWKEVQIPMRDGSYLAANLYQPDSDGQFPVLMTLCPYGKDVHFSEFAPVNPTIVKEYSQLQDKGPLLSWEAPNPEFWGCPKDMQYCVSMNAALATPQENWIYYQNP